MGREIHTGQKRSWGPVPKGSWHLKNNFGGVAVAEERVFDSCSFDSLLSAPGWVRRPGCDPVLDPELAHFTFH